MRVSNPRGRGKVECHVRDVKGLAGSLRSWFTMRAPCKPTNCRVVVMILDLVGCCHSIRAVVGLLSPCFSLRSGGGPCLVLSWLLWFAIWRGRLCFAGVSPRMRSARRGCIGGGLCYARVPPRVARPPAVLRYRSSAVPRAARRGQTTACFLVWVHKSRTRVVLERITQTSSQDTRTRTHQ